MVIEMFDEMTQRVNYLISFSRIPTESEFLKRAKVIPGTYSGNLTSRIYSRIFVRSLDLKRDFQLYYEAEYGTFEKYLRKRHLIDAAHADSMAGNFRNSASIVLAPQIFSFWQDEEDGNDPALTLIEEDSI